MALYPEYIINHRHIAFINYIDGLRLADRWQQLQITGIDGQQTFLQMGVKNSTRVEIATEGLRPGMYIAILSNTSGVEIYLKFIKL
jgi:hypothetical protein